MFCFRNAVLIPALLYADLRRLQYPKSAMGVCIVRRFHVLRVQREASRVGRASELCQASGREQAIPQVSFAAV